MLVIFNVNKREILMAQKTELTDKQRKYIFICIIITCVAGSFLATAITTALPSIMVELNIDASLGQWLTSGYSLAQGIVLPLTAFLFTRFSSKKLYISAISITLLGLLMAAEANSFGMLMFSRILQASGNGILYAMAQVILLTIYPPERQGTVMGWYGLSIGGATVAAPIIGGVIVDVINWRAIFYLTFFIFFINFILAIKVFEDVLENRIVKFDIFSFVLSGIAFAGITLGIGNIGVYPFISTSVLGVLVIGIFATIVFVVRQYRLADPFLDLSVLKNKSFVIAVIGSMILYAIILGPAVIMPLYIQNILEKSATITGLVMLPGSVAMMLINPFSGKMYDKVGIKLLYIVGSIMMLISNLGMSFLSVDTTIWVATFFNTTRNVAIACLMMPLVTWSIGNVEESQKAHGSAVLSALRAIAAALGAAVFLNIMNYIAKNGDVPMSKVALIQGSNAAYLGMSLLSILMLVIGVFFIDEKKKSNI